LPPPGLSWADLNDDSMDNNNKAPTDNEVVRNDVLPPPGLSWADLNDDSMDNNEAQSELNDSSMGVKRDLDIADLSWVTQNGYGDAPGAYRNLPKTICAYVPNMCSFAPWPASYQQMSVMMPLVPVMMFPLDAGPARHGSDSCDDIAVPVSTPVLTKRDMMKKRQEEIKTIQKDFAEDVVANTPFTRTDLFHVNKRPWEKAKTEYRNDLKISQLKIQTQLDEDVINLALEAVYTGKMKSQEHIHVALEYLRSNSLA